MKLLYSSPNALLVAHLRNVLESAGVACHVKNEFLYSAAGELPPTETWPELWVEAADLDRAQDIIDDAVADKSRLPQWRCRECGESIEGQFSSCWRCGAERAERTTPTE
jgi:rubrerythrin